jgi:phospholipid/cholesterol/gamma-HCH transport system ATP-binding protein
VVTPPFIQIKNLHKSFGTQHVLRGLDLDIYRGETLVLIGPSGEGKSVTLKQIIGLNSPDLGSVSIEGTDLANLNERQLIPYRRRMGYMFQNAALFDSFTVAQNVAFPLLEKGIKDHDLIHQLTTEALQWVELEEHADKMPINLSGGMRKRVGIARAIITKPECILYDEPTAGLDPIVTDVIDMMIKRMQKKLNVTSIVITHDMNSVMKIADRVGMLLKGVLHFIGTPTELQNSSDPYIQDFIHGRSHTSA